MLGLHQRVCLVTDIVGFQVVVAELPKVGTDGITISLQNLHGEGRSLL